MGNRYWQVEMDGGGSPKLCCTLLCVFRELQAMKPRLYFAAWVERQQGSNNTISRDQQYEPAPARPYGSDSQHCQRGWVRQPADDGLIFT